MKQTLTYHHHISIPLRRSLWAGVAPLLVGLGLAFEAEAGVVAPTGPVDMQGTPAGALRRASSMEQAALWQGGADQLRLLSTPPQGWLPTSDDAETLYLEAVALYGMDNPECVALLDRFVTLYPQSPRALEARLMAGDYWFFDHSYPAALSAYADIPLDELDSSRRNLYTYRTMLSMLKCGFDSEALPLLRLLQGAGGEYALPALYYQGYLDYRPPSSRKARTMPRSTSG